RHRHLWIPGWTLSAFGWSGTPRFEGKWLGSHSAAGPDECATRRSTLGAQPRSEPWSGTRLAGPPGRVYAPPMSPSRRIFLLSPATRPDRRPLHRAAPRLAEHMASADAAILLGSIATPKYLPPLREILGPRLRVPQEFIGRGVMSRGALMLKCAAEGRELTYI